jgi:hypothetical protein
VKRAVFVLSPPKTGTQSVYRSLVAAGAPGLAVFHAHTLDRSSSLLSEVGPDSAPVPAATLSKWRTKALKEHTLLRALLDVRALKTLVFIRRDSRARLQSRLFHVHFKTIASHYDHAADRFRDPAALQATLETLLRDMSTADSDYHDQVYAPLGVPPDAVEAPFSITQIRPDLEVAALRFERLEDDFARLGEHIGLPGIALLHVNQARNRKKDTPGQMRPADDFERALYAAFKRDYSPPDEFVDASTRARSLETAVRH